jgi:hypothetical protein
VVIGTIILLAAVLFAVYFELTKAITGRRTRQPRP